MWENYTALSAHSLNASTCRTYGAATVARINEVLEPQLAAFTWSRNCRGVQIVLALQLFNVGLPPSSEVLGRHVQLRRFIGPGTISRNRMEAVKQLTHYRQQEPWRNPPSACRSRSSAWGPRSCRGNQDRKRSAGPRDSRCST